MRKSIFILLLYIIGMLSSSIPYAVIQEVGINDPGDVLLFISTYTIVFVLLLFFVVTILKREFTPFIKRFWTNSGLIIGFFVMAFVLSIVANIILELLQVTDEAVNQGGLIDMLRLADRSIIVILVLLFCIVIPIIEELVYRRGIYGFIRRFVEWLCRQYFPEMDVRKAYRVASYSAIVLSGLIFGLIHIQGDFIYLLHYGTAGIIIGASYYLSKENIYVPLGIHILQNTLGVTQILILIQEGII